jgi:succinate dehydrogenase / fumarate reductase, iron-sulfur subunit
LPHDKTYQVRVARATADGISTGVQQFEVALEERMTVLDALFRIQRLHDPSLSFRCACRVGMCGTCAISINGVPRLACKTRPLLLDSPRIELAPLPNLPVMKDLVVSMEPFFAQWKRVRPALHSRNPNAAELVRVPADSQYMRETQAKRDCITCGACYAACGIKSSSGEYLGPAAINRAFLRLLDPRDTATAERLSVIDSERGGLWRCHTQYNCTAVCPKGITLTDSISWLKRAMLFPRRLQKA